MSKIAIIYYSMSGNTKYIAEYLKDKLNADIIRLTPKKEYPNKGLKKFFWGGKSAVMKETPSLEEYQFNSNKYDIIILGSPIWASTFTPPLRTFIKENNLKDKHLAVFLSCSGGRTDKAINNLKKELEIDNFIDTLVLIDPKNKKTKEKDNQIEIFYNNIKKESDNYGNTK